MLDADVGRVADYVVRGREAGGKKEVAVGDPGGGKALRLAAGEATAAKEVGGGGAGGGDLL